MRSVLIAMLAAILFGGCVSSPETYSGPTAQISDSVIPINGMKMYCFWVSRVDGRPIPTTPGETRRINRGKGFHMEPKTIARPIPARKVVLRLEGSRIFAADILTLTNKSFAVGGDVEFVPKENGRYVVKGMVGASGSSVWVEDAETGEVVTTKIERTGR